MEFDDSAIDSMQSGGFVKTELINTSTENDSGGNAGDAE